MYDIHAHILPAIDDGPRNSTESLEMVFEASRCGTDVLVATPHMRDVNEKRSVEYVTSSLNLLQHDIANYGVDIEIKIGMENHLNPDSPAMFKKGKSLTINRTNFALIELPFFGHPKYIDDVLLELQHDGLIPVLAHPERIELIQQDPTRLAYFIDKGMISQVTAGSLIGQFGQDVKSFTEQLIKNNLVHVIASDCHRPVGRRAPNLTVGYQAAVRLIGHSRAKKLVCDNPESIINGVRLSDNS